MHKLKIKPMSVNAAYRGRRFKTSEYKEYEETLMLILPGEKDFNTKDKLAITYRFGLSNTQSDVDNPVKPFTDILQKAYGFNDRMVYEMHVYKEKVKRGEEYIEFTIERMTP